MGAEIRDMVRGFLRDLLDESKGRKLERCVYNWALERAVETNVPRFWESREFRQLYLGKARSVRFNLKNKANPDFRQKVLDGTVNLEKIPKMLPWEIFPALWTETFEQVAEMQLKREAATVALPDDYKSLIQCRKCKQHKVTYTTLQTRSADEPETVFASCTICRHRFRM
jgi:transcription elongation factor S-II